MSYELILSVVAAIVAGAWAYGSSGPEKRENFKNWLSDCTQRLRPGPARVAEFLVRFVFLLLCLGTAAIVWSSLSNIYQFLVSDEPIRRAEIFNLILHVFNAFSYLLASFTLLMLTFKLPAKETSCPRNERAHQFRLIKDKTITPEQWADFAEIGINVRLQVLTKGKYELHIESEGVVIESVAKASQCSCDTQSQKVIIKT